MSVPKAPPDYCTVLYFASASSHTGKSHDFLPVPLKITELYGALDKKYPGFREKVLDSAAITVNLDYVDLDEECAKGEECTVICAGDEVGVIPPVSSG
jgi:molybdopterin converting factor small subunit